MEERLHPACAFAISVLADYDQDPNSVPEEAVEAARAHRATCSRCGDKKIANMPAYATGTPGPRKRKKVHRVAEDGREHEEHVFTTPIAETPPPIAEPIIPQPEQSKQTTILPLSSATPEGDEHMVITDNGITCQQCRQLLPEYAETMDSQQNVAALYPEVQMHLLTCESGCLILLDLLRQEARATRKYRRKPVRDPLSAIGWELSGFFRGGQVPMSPMALAYGTLILLLIVASLGAYLGINWNEARYHSTNTHLLPTPDGIGLSDGLHVYDACNSTSYQNKRDAAQALREQDLTQADHLFAVASTAVQADSSGCNGAEAAIYREDLHIRLSGRPYSLAVVSFDSGPGDANPQGGTDRHLLYAAYTQELVGALIAQQTYNQAQMRIAGAPLLYLILANTTGVEAGAIQIANAVVALAQEHNPRQAGLLARGEHPLMGVLGMGPSSLAEVILPVLCRAGIPLIAPTATGQFLITLLTQTTLYRHCTPGFAFIRFSPDDTSQSALAASYAYNRLKARNAAIFYDPSDPASSESAQGFASSFSHYASAQIVATEAAVASGLLDANGRPQASRADIAAGLNDALKAKTRLDLIFAPVLTSDVITLAQTIAHLPADQQPVLLVGGEFIQPAALQGLVQWSRQQQLTLPHIFVSVVSAARPPTEGDWQKQFYASFCTSFATPGSFCSGTAALDQGALLFGDGIEVIARGIGASAQAYQLPGPAQLVHNISLEQFAGVGCPIALVLHENVLVTSTEVLPVMLGLQQDGSIQIVK